MCGLTLIDRLSRLGLYFHGDLLLHHQVLIASIRLSHVPNEMLLGAVDADLGENVYPNRLPTIDVYESRWLLRIDRFLSMPSTSDPSLFDHAFLIDEVTSELVME